MALRDAFIEEQYSNTLDSYLLLAQQDFLDWWRSNETSGFVDLRKMAEEPFDEIIRVYGAQAALSTADYIVNQRSLSDEISGLQYPKVANPETYEKQKSAFMWATTVKDAKMLSSTDDALQQSMRDEALEKLQTVINRVVLLPGRETVYMATKSAGTRFARIPEPGACAFCLMLASRGAVYTKKSKALGDVKKFHQGCRCLAIECSGDHDLPKINRDLKKVWSEEGADGMQRIVNERNARNKSS